MENNKIHFVTFYTNKYPALDLSNEEIFLRQLIGKNFDSYTAYNPDLIDKKYTKSYPEFNVKEHSRGCFHGFWAWKPHIILKKVLDVEYGDIIIYSDCNISRYKSRIEDTLKIKETALKLFNHIDCDFLISKDHNKLKIKHHVKIETLKSIVGSSWHGLLSASLLHANRVFVRKSQLSIDILGRWEELCSNENLLLPTLPEKFPLRWHTHDQAIITALTRKLMIDKVLPDSWPGFVYDYNILIPSKKIMFDMRNKKNNRFYYNAN
jgi:hypothetical protein